MIRAALVDGYDFSPLSQKKRSFLADHTGFLFMPLSRSKGGKAGPVTAMILAGFLLGICKVCARLVVDILNACNLCACVGLEGFCQTSHPVDRFKRRLCLRTSPMEPTMVQLYK